MAKYDWIKLKQEYILGKYKNLKEFAEKKGITYSVLRKKAKEWNAEKGTKREQKGNKIIEKGNTIISKKANDLGVYEQCNLDENKNAKTPSPFARLRNRNAEKTGEYIKLYYDDLEQSEKELLNLSEDIGIYQKLIKQDAEYTLLKKHIRGRIKELKSQLVCLNLKLISTTGKTDRQLMEEQISAIDEEIFRREQALGNVLAKHDKLLVNLAKLEQDDEKLLLYQEKHNLDSEKFEYQKLLDDKKAF